MSAGKTTGAKRGWLAITLRSGQTFRSERDTLPRHWKSWLMDQPPYGTDFRGCTFSKGRNS
jgi:hypothetical protein